MHGVIGLLESGSAEKVVPFRGAPISTPKAPSVFHERWWLDAVAQSGWGEVTLEEGGRTVGRFPFFETRPLGFRVIGMPPFTRTLGPWVAEFSGKSVTRRDRERHIVAELIAKLPPHTFFRQLLPASFDNILPFQNAGFCIGLEHSIEIDGRASEGELWNAIHHKMRSLIKRADEQHNFEVLEDPEEFCRFYRHNIELRGRTLDFESSDFLRLYRAGQVRNACSIFAMRHANKSLAAAIFLVQWSGRLHFLLQTRDPLIAAAGAVECLIWYAIKKAAKQSLILDLDGIPNQNTAHRLLPFGGDIRLRTIATRGSAIVLAARQLKKSLGWSADKQSAIFC